MSALRVAHVITGLQTGGAEVLLLRVLERLAGTEIDGEVTALTGPGPLGAPIEGLGVKVTALDLHSPPGPAGLSRLRREIRAARPDVVQTWLLHSNVLGGIVARFSGRAPVCWGVHITDVEAAVHGRVAARLQRVERALAKRLPAAIVACSESSAEAMRRLGYPESKLVTIPNGFDTDVHRPDPGDRAAGRRELGISDEELVVGHVARFHPMKDQRNLLEAAALVAERLPSARFVLCGRGLTPDNEELAAWAAPLGDRVRLLGERADIARLYRAFDLVALSSAAAEALPLVVGEAMASGVPVVATDCGDSPWIVADAGRIVPPRESRALAEAITELLRLPADERLRLGERARARIEERYSLDGMVAGYVNVWRRLAGQSRRTA